jgi:hypothetical protein
MKTSPCPLNALIPASTPVRRFLAPLVLALVVAGHLAAATLTVTNLADNGPGTLRQLIADSSPGGTLDFAVTGTINQPSLT